MPSFTTLCAGAALALAVAVSAKDNLPPGDSLRIGVKKKNECTRRTQKGDSISMEYTVRERRAHDGHNMYDRRIRRVSCERSRQWLTTPLSVGHALQGRVTIRFVRGPRTV